MSSKTCELLCPFKFNPNNCPPFCYPPPPPPPPPGSYHPPPPPPAPPYQSNQDTLRIIIIITATVASIFLLIAFRSFILKLSNRNTPSNSLSPTNNTTHQVHLQCDVGGLGLEESVINSITVCTYKRSGEVLIEGSECSICLNDFREDEKLRLLPNCIHAYHLPCIDTWLKSNANCPLCRMKVISNPMSSLPKDPSSSSSFSGSEEEPQNRIGVETNGSDGVRGNHSSVHVDVYALEDLSSPAENCGFRSQSDLGAVETINDDIQLVQISVSVDSE